MPEPSAQLSDSITTSSLEDGSIPKIKWQSFVAWGLGIATNYIHFGITQVNCIIVAFVLEAVLSVIFHPVKNKVVSAA